MRAETAAWFVPGAVRARPSKKKGRDKRVRVVSGTNGKGPTSAWRRVRPDCARHRDGKETEEENGESRHDNAFGAPAAFGLPRFNRAAADSHAGSGAALVNPVVRNYGIPKFRVIRDFAVPFLRISAPHRVNVEKSLTTGPTVGSPQLHRHIRCKREKKTSDKGSVIFLQTQSPNIQALSTKLSTFQPVV